MQRFLALTIALTTAVGTMSAGTIQTQIGGANGLTAALLDPANGTNTLGNTGNWNEKNYDNYLFSGANNGSPTTPYTTYHQTSASTGTIVDGGVTFNMINDGCGSVTSGAANSCTGSTNSNNVWVAPVSTVGTPSTLTIPIGIYAVTDLSTLMSNVYGNPSISTDTTVVFNWGNSAGVTNGTSLTINLSNAGTSGHGGQIGTAIDCTTAGTSATCNTFAIGGLSSTNTTLSGVSVKADQLTVGSYNVAIGGSNMFSGSTAGNLTLDDQEFFFNGLNSNLYLVNVQIKELSGTTTVSQTAISAVTVDSTTATPEPASIWLGLTGLLGVGLGVIRRRRA